MKVLLLGFGKIAYMPYMSFYLDTFKQNENIEFELIYWDRDGKPDAPIPERVSKAYRFEAYLEEQLPFSKKLKFFAKYRRFALKILKNTNYDRIIVLQATPGLTLLDYLIRRYKGRYLLDFRDLSYENISIYRKLVGLLSENSGMTLISSGAFRKYLPESEKIWMVHNFLEESLLHQGIRERSNRERSVIRISFWGLIRQAEINKALIDALGNDKRFELHYYGRMQQAGREMEHYSRENGYANVFFHGAYMPADRYDFAERTDIIHNIYECDFRTGNATGNKYYDGIIFRIPQICSKGSYMGDIVTEMGVGKAVSMNGIADELWQYYQTIDWKVFDSKCEEALQSILDEQEETRNQLNVFIQEVQVKKSI